MISDNHVIWILQGLYCLSPFFPLRSPFGTPCSLLVSSMSAKSERSPTEVILLLSIYDKIRKGVELGWDSVRDVMKDTSRDLVSSPF